MTSPILVAVFTVAYLAVTVWLCRGIRLTARDLCQQVAHSEQDRNRRGDHSVNAPFRANMWFMGPEPWPRSSMAANAPEMYSLARSTDSSRS